MGFKTKSYLIQIRVVRILMKENQKFGGGFERVESDSWRNLTDIGLVKF